MMQIVREVLSRRLWLQQIDINGRDQYERKHLKLHHRAYTTISVTLVSLFTVKLATATHCVCVKSNSKVSIFC